ncbi:MAG: ribonuclease M5 [Candidatus Izemoplasmataceae bacterium]
MFKEVVVVEGNHDKSRLKQIFEEIDVVITNGAEISQETLDLLKHLNQKRGLILLLDPDYPGERIRRIINEYVGETKHAFIEKKYCIDEKKNKVGIEHAPLHIIKEVLLTKVQTQKDVEHSLTINDLVELGLTGRKDSKEKREKIASYYHFATSNAKTFLKYLNMFGISKNELEKVLS